MGGSARLHVPLGRVALALANLDSINADIFQLLPDSIA
jgi:hypothetical protein